MISSNCRSPKQLIFLILVFSSWNHISMGFNCGLQAGKYMTLTFQRSANFIVSSLSWMEQLSRISQCSRCSSYCKLYSFSKSYLMKSRYSYLRQLPSMIRQWARPSSSIIAINENLFPLEMGQFTASSSFGLDHAFSRIMQRLKPDSSRKQTLARFSNISIYFAQNQYRFSSCLEVLRSLGTHLTLFFLYFPIFISLATAVLVISTLSPSFTLFRSQILLSYTQISFKVRKGFSLINLPTCYNLSRVNLLSGARLHRSCLTILSQKVGSSSHSLQRSWIMLGLMSNCQESC